MKTLKDVLLEKKIRLGIQGNLGNLIYTDMSPYIDEIIEKDSNITGVKIDEGEIYDFECTLHYDEEKDIYLLEARLFRESDNSMVNGYLEVLDSNLDIIDEEIDDVWSYGDWEEAC